jgi:hypothetical protein
MRFPLSLGPTLQRVWTKACTKVCTLLQRVCNSYAPARLKSDGNQIEEGDYADKHESAGKASRC